MLLPQRSLLCWPELSLEVEPPTGASRAEPTLQLNGCGCMKTLGPPLHLLGVAPIRGQGQNPLLAPDWVVSSQDSCYRAVTAIGNKRHYHSCPEDGESSFSLELASGCFPGFLYKRMPTLSGKNMKISFMHLKRVPNLAVPLLEV